MRRSALESRRPMADAPLTGSVCHKPGAGTPRHPMDERSDHQLIAGLIATAATSSEAGPRELVARLKARYSRGSSDRGNAIAAEWLRRWQPKPALLALPECACPAGRCTACN